MLSSCAVVRFVTKVALIMSVFLSLICVFIYTASFFGGSTFPNRYLSLATDLSCSQVLNFSFIH